MAIEEELGNVLSEPKGWKVRRSIRRILEHAYNVNCGIEMLSADYTELGDGYETDALYLITDTGGIYKNGVQYASGESGQTPVTEESDFMNDLNVIFDTRENGTATTNICSILKEKIVSCIDFLLNCSFGVDMTSDIYTSLTEEEKEALLKNTLFSKYSHPPLEVQMSFGSIKNSKYGYQVRNTLWTVLYYLLNGDISVVTTSEDYDETNYHRDVIYYLTDTGEIYKNGIKYGGGMVEESVHEALLFVNPVMGFTRNIRQYGTFSWSTWQSPGESGASSTLTVTPTKDCLLLACTVSRTTASIEGSGWTKLVESGYADPSNRKQRITIWYKNVAAGSYTVTASQESSSVWHLKVIALYNATNPTVIQNVVDPSWPFYPVASNRKQRLHMFSNTLSTGNTDDIGVNDNGGLSMKSANQTRFYCWYDWEPTMRGTPNFYTDGTGNVSVLVIDFDTIEEG